MKNRGSASIWLLVSLLGILVAAEFGLGYFFIKNKEEIEKNGGIVTDRYLDSDEQRENSIGFNLFGIPFFEPRDFSEEFPVPENDYESGYSFVPDGKIAMTERFEIYDSSWEFFGGAYVTQDPVAYKNDNPAVKLSGSAAYFSGGSMRGKPIQFIPSGKNWDEGSISFVVKPEKQPTGNQWLINLNWNNYQNPDSGYAYDVMLTKDMKIQTLCWSWGQKGDGAAVNTSSFLPLGSWSKVQIIWSKQKNFTHIYLNGALDVVANKVCPPASNGNIYPWYGGFGGFYGWLDDVKFSTQAPDYPDVE